MNANFGEELTLDEILSEEEKAEDRFIRSAPGSNFGPELTLEQVMEILHQSALPPRASFWEKNDRVIREALHSHETRLEVGDYKFKIEYFARITSVRKYEFTTPMSYIQFYPNGKGPEIDSQSGDSNSSTTGGSSNPDVRADC